ncbi:MAG TPA: helix-turn-helix transcriptional regulator [Bauldia sp.]|nr:helix-turn-helix transcriptional regulator [Bauldia sp.]
MVVATAMLALGESFRDMTTTAQIVDALEAFFRSLGATHFLLTGFPLPGRPIEPLVVRVNWGELRSPSALSPRDPLLDRGLSARHPQLWALSADDVRTGASVLLSSLPADRPINLLVSPICAFLPYQGVMMAAGAGLMVETKVRLAVDHVAAEALRRLIDLGSVRPERPGELSARERRVVELSAHGKTANEIAEILDISQRTVHAHLQNASEKLGASNKTHTVVEALRYGQISV